MEAIGNLMKLRDIQFEEIEYLGEFIQKEVSIRTVNSPRRCEFPLMPIPVGLSFELI